MLTKDEQSTMNRLKGLRSHLTTRSFDFQPKRPISKLLVANRGEIAVRILRAAHELGISTVAVYEKEDEHSLHVRYGDETVFLSSYMDPSAVVEAARRTASDAVHPGYGFLSEKAELASMLQASGICFVGPSPGCLSVFGDKLQARRLAMECGVPVLKGSQGVFNNAADVAGFVAQQGIELPYMIKTPRGGGGLGIHVIGRQEDLDKAFLAPNPDGYFVEELCRDARHVEVQVLGDGSGNARHLFDRDCSIQTTRHQKMVELAPANLPPGLRARMTTNAVDMLEKVEYSGAGTVEFLATPDASADDGFSYYFLEVNPRLQVEHTITEEITGVDIVQAQMRIAAGASLADIGLADQEQITCKGTAVQARLGFTSPGVLEMYHEPSGKGVRVDSGIDGSQPGSPSFKYDPLLAKIIAFYPGDWSQGAVWKRLQSALDSTTVSGTMTTNLDTLRAVVRHGTVTTYGDTFLPIPTHFLQTETPSLEAIMNTLPTKASSLSTTDTIQAKEWPTAPEGVESLIAPVAGSVSAVRVGEGEKVETNQVLCVVTSMKMDTLVHATGPRVIQKLLVKPGDIVEANQPLAWLRSMEDGSQELEAKPKVNEELVKGQEVRAKIQRMRELGQLMGGIEKVERHRSMGRTTIRDKVTLLIDAGTFNEIGRMTGEFDEDGDFTPGNFVLGTGQVDGETVVVGGEDFTIKGGSPNLAGLRKSIYTETMALELMCPLVRLHEGGGGSVAGSKGKLKSKKKKETSQQRTSLGDPVYTRPRFETVAKCMAEVPCASAAMGSVAGLPASRLVATHFSVMVESAQVLIAGPAVVERALGYKTSKEELGSASVHTRNGVVDNLANDAEDAMRQIKQFLSYMPRNRYHVPPVVPCTDPIDRCDEELLTIVSPLYRRQTYEMREILDRVFDNASVFEVGQLYGGGLVTAYARLNGKPVGVIANDPKVNGGAMCDKASIKVRRFMEICENFSLPIVYLVDEPGFMIGKDSEEAGTIRFGTAAVLTACTLTVPTISVIVRKVYGVAGAAHFAPNGRRYVWPTAELGALPVESGVAVAFRRVLESIPEGPEREAKRAELEKQFSHRLSPFPATQSFAFHDMLSPPETRPLLCSWVDQVWPLVQTHVQSKGNRGFQIKP